MGREACLLCENKIDYRRRMNRWIRISTCYEEAVVCHVCNDPRINPYVVGQLEYIETAWLAYDQENEQLASRYEKAHDDRLGKCRKGRNGT